MAPVAQVVAAEVKTAFRHIDFRNQSCRKWVADFHIAQWKEISIDYPDGRLIVRIVPVEVTEGSRQTRIFGVDIARVCRIIGIISTYIVTLVLALAGSSCSDYLDKEYDASLSEKKVFNNQNLTREFLANIYTNLPDGLAPL